MRAIGERKPFSRKTGSKMSPGPPGEPIIIQSAPERSPIDRALACGDDLLVTITISVVTSGSERVALVCGRPRTDHDVSLAFPKRHNSNRKQPTGDLNIDFWKTSAKAEKCCRNDLCGGERGNTNRNGDMLAAFGLFDLLLKASDICGDRACSRQDELADLGGYHPA